MQRVEGIETFGREKDYPYALLKITPDECVYFSRVAPAKSMSWYCPLFGHMNDHHTIMTMVATQREYAGQRYWVSLLAKLKDSLRFQLLQTYAGFQTVEHATQVSILVHKLTELAGFNEKKPKLMDTLTAQMVVNALAACDPLAEMERYIQAFS